jgi:hypothetical protein
MKFTEDGAIGAEWWVESSSLSFPEIVEGSRLIDKWARYDITHNDVKNNILIPVNRYVSSLYPRPEIVSIKDNVVQLRQKTHSEIWIKPRKDGMLYALDKAWQRQFYPSANSFSNDECFNPTYRFYMPWIFSQSIDLLIVEVKKDYSPFIVNSKNIKNVIQDGSNKYANTNFVDFKIKKNNKYMFEGKYGIIDIGTSMYDVFAKLTTEQISRLVKEYG